MSDSHIAADKGGDTEQDGGGGSSRDAVRNSSHAFVLLFTTVLQLDREVPSGQHNMSGDAAGTPSEKKDFSDLVTVIPGLYRVLDLMHERGSGGLGEPNKPRLEFLRRC